MSTLTTTLPANEAFSVRTIELVTPKGNVSGTRTFFGGMSAADLNKHFAAQGLKGNAKKKAVAAALGNPEANRRVLSNVFVESLLQDGYVPDVADRREKTAVLKFVKAANPEDESKAKIAEQEAALAAQAAKIAELEAMLAGQLK